MASTSFAAPVGEILDGKFRITKEIGRGGMATVYSAENISIGKPVAVKILASELATSKTVTERFLREARAAARIHSPYICEVYDVGTYDDRPFIVMELLRGESLYDRLARERQLSAQETLLIAVQTARALKRAHELHVVHRDLKPENIFLTQGEDGALHTKLVDFGLAKFYEPHLDPDNARLTKEGALFGTPAYMSPEQAKAKGGVDHRSDLWALGCIVFEMLTGRTVWDVEQGVAMILAQIATAQIPSARTYRPDLPPQFDAWLAKALNRNVEHRFQDADEFVLELGAALNGAEATAPALRAVAPTSGPTSSIPPSPRAPSPGTAGGLASPRAEYGASHEEARVPEPSLGEGTSRRWVWFAAAAFVLGAGVGGFLFAGKLRTWFGGALATTAEAGAFGVEISEAQAAFAAGDVEQGVEQLKAVFDKGQDKVARSLLANAGVALETPSGECRLSAVGHPRPFDSSTDSSDPAIAEVPKGLLVAWTDRASAEETTHTRVALMDSALRRVSSVTNVTPQSSSARGPVLLPVGERTGLAFWDFEGSQAGAYTGLLGGEGNLVGPPSLLSSSVERHPYNVALTADRSGGYWAAWVEPSRERVFDIAVRKLDDELRPTMNAVNVTGYAIPIKGKTQADRPSLAVTSRALIVSYTLRRNNKQHVVVLRVPRERLTNGAGVVPERASSPGDEEGDRFLGQAVQVNEAPGNHDQSTVRCDSSDRCFVTWDDAANTGFVALFHPDGQLLWRKSLGSDSGRPTVSLGNAGPALSWFENKRVQFARLGDNGPINPTAVGRISAVLQQPPPVVIPSRNTQGRWYVAWRGYEAAVQEPFLARVDCP